MIPQHIIDLIEEARCGNGFTKTELKGILWATKEELKFIENHFPECKTKTNRVKYKKEIIKAIEECLK